MGEPGSPGVAFCGLGHHPAFSLTLLSSGARAFLGVTVEESLPSDPVPKRQDHDHIPPVSGSDPRGPGWGLPPVHTPGGGCALIRKWQAAGRFVNLKRRRVRMSWPTGRVGVEIFQVPFP